MGLLNPLLATYKTAYYLRYYHFLFFCYKMLLYHTAIQESRDSYQVPSVCRRVSPVSEMSHLSETERAPSCKSPSQVLRHTHTNLWHWELE